MQKTPAPAPNVVVCRRVMRSTTVEAFAEAIDTGSMANSHVHRAKRDQRACALVRPCHGWADDPRLRGRLTVVNEAAVR